MLLDVRHRPWWIGSGLVLVAAGGLYVPYHLSRLNGPSGGSGPGLAYGIASFVLMVFAGLLGLRRSFPAVRAGRPEIWMRGHLWLGLLTLPLAFLHGGFRLGGTLTCVIMFLLILVSASGVLGLVLQQILPRVMTSRVPMETIFDQIDSVSAQLLAEADTLVAAASAEDALPLRDLYQRHVRPFLEDPRRGGSLASAAGSALVFGPVRTLLPPAHHEALKDLEVICEERRQLVTQARLHRWLHGWLLVHVPLSYVLLVLAAVHAVAAVKY
jgi:hypothetical protein